jgi:hypothetical protein
MRPQVFQNDGRGRFLELDPATLGDFFQQVQLGRSLARLDWNRDGRSDFVVMHLEAPVALLSNQTATSGHSITVRLRGVTQSRDAVGAIVSVTSGQRVWTRQLMAGDGFQASNERSLTFGLGHDTSVSQLDIHWPGGRHERFGELPVDCDLTFVENRGFVVTPRGF